jgi:hypothetical protein
MVVEEGQEGRRRREKQIAVCAAAHLNHNF